MAKEKFLYMKVYTDLKQKIEEGKFLPGEKFPGEEELKEKYQVSVITIKHAIQMLVEEGYVNRIPGKGSFVTEKEERGKAGGFGKKKEEVSERQSHAQEKLIGVILEYAMESYGLQLMYELDRALRDAGYKMILRFTYTDREKEMEEIEFLTSLGISGLIILPCHGFYYNTALLKLVIEGFPMVVLDKKMEGISVPSIRTDNKDGVYRLVEYLKNQGKSRIGIITVSETGAVTLKERRKAFAQCIEEFRLPVMKECILPEASYGIIKNKPDENYVMAIMEYLKKYGQSLDGVVCMEYGLLLAFLEAAKRLGKESFGNILPCCFDKVYLAPGGVHYAHIKQNETSMANKAVEVLEAQIRGEKIENNEIKIPGIFRE